MWPKEPAHLIILRAYGGAIGLVITENYSYCRDFHPVENSCAVARLI